MITRNGVTRMTSCTERRSSRVDSAAKGRGITMGGNCPGRERRRRIVTVKAV